MKPIRLFLIISFLPLLVQSLSAQEEKPALDKGSIDSRFSYVLSRSEDFEDAKVVKKWMLYRLKTYVADSLNALRSELASAYNQISSNESGNDSLKTKIDDLNIKLSAAIKEKNSLSLMGINMGKQSYNILMWSIVALLVFFMLIFFFLFKRSNTVTVKTIQSLNETKDEFEAFRKRALEREQKVVREMYDEILKYKNKAGN